MNASPTARAVTSDDGTTISYHALGFGEPLLIVGGSLCTARSYLHLAEMLAARFEVHVIDRRGRGASGPLGPEYSIRKEREDLLAVQAATGATKVFGHSYGGLVALQTAIHSNVFEPVAAYEPGVSTTGSIPTAWTEHYGELLNRGDRRRAFAYFVQHAGHAPRPVAKLPLWYLRAILRLMLRGAEWARIDPLLEANLAEHHQLASLDASVSEYGRITADVLLIGGSKSPAFITDTPFGELKRVVPVCAAAMITGLDHRAPESNPTKVAEHLAHFMSMSSADETVTAQGN
jgi:pimeloyl-ACP methyl ester carboxylesterase